jgi:hypothetical protein
MKQESSLTQKLAAAQEAHAQAQRNAALQNEQFPYALSRESPRSTSPLASLYSLYCEARGDIAGIVARYFPGATFTYGVGLWQGKTESSVVVTIIVTEADLIDIGYLIGDIKRECQQESVLLTIQPVRAVLL